MDMPSTLQYSLDEYRQEMDECDRLYSRAGFYLASIPVVGAVSFWIVSHLVAASAPESTVLVAWARIAGILFASVAVLFVFLAGVFLSACVLPREYERVYLPHKVVNYRREYSDSLVEHGYPPEFHERVLQDSVAELLLQRACSCAQVAHQINERRNAWLHRASVVLLVGLLAFGVACCCAFVVIQPFSTKEQVNGEASSAAAAAAAATATSTSGV